MFDGHCDIFTDVTIKRLQGETQVLQKHHLERLKKGGFTGGCFVFWIDPPYTENPPARLEQLLQCASDELAECKGAVLVRNLKEIEAAKTADKFYILAGMEGLSGLGSNVEQLYQLHDFGIREVMLTWNEQNAFATGAKGDKTRGLTDLGKEAISIIQEKKMILDVSHLNEKSFWDVIKVAQTPILASHSNAKALANVARNLTDDQLFAIRDTKGLIGLNSFVEFLHDDPKEQTLDQFAKHAAYIAEKIGVEHLGFGFDFCEFLSNDSLSSFVSADNPYIIGLEDCSKTPVFLEKLKEVGFSDAEILQIAEKNWLHLIERVIG
ncbi:dipeptidase [Chakrabartyella piscis]|uniref:dipeptidase n=1 Tax=Chakrabartyella piscis TaxID=2918914 RepID=UPI0029589DDA|nr:membrane dipeptidase [Chakrabartyella piscis]